MTTNQEALNPDPEPRPQMPSESDPDALEQTEPSADADDATEDAADQGSGSGGDRNADGVQSAQAVIGASTEASNTTEKDPSTWVTGDEPMTGAQRSYLDTLARDAGEQLPADLTKADASQQIERLQEKTGRGQ